MYLSVPPESIYFKALAAFFKDNGLGENSRSAASYACLEDGTVTGAASLDENPLHPQAFHLKIFVSAPFRRQGIGSKLISHLAKAHRKAFRAGVDSADHMAIAFLESQGFSRAIRCYLPEYEAHELIHRPMDSRAAITPFTQLDDARMALIQKRLHEDYVQNHFYNPPKSDLDALTFAGAAMKGHVPAHSYAIFHASRLAGYLIAFEADETSLEIGYMGGDGSLNAEIDGAFHRILKQLFESFQTLCFEVDDVDRQGMRVLKLFKTLPQTSWDVYFKRDHL